MNILEGSRRFLKPKIMIDGREAGRLRHGTYLAFYARVGVHRIDAVKGEDFHLYTSPSKYTIASLTLTSKLAGDSFILWTRVQGVFLNSWRLEDLGATATGMFRVWSPPIQNYGRVDQ